MDKEYLGYRLLERGFEVWFRYVFRIIEGHSFVVEPIHADLFQVVQDIFDGKELRIACNVPPRSAKTTLMKYFIAYCWAIDPTMNFIYTSYSETLLAGISRELMNILEHPAFLQMYPKTKASEDDTDITPTEEFWFEHLKQYYNGKNVYTSKRITTYRGGICLFSPIGGQITGFGSGKRTAKSFSGALIIDDPQKPSEIRSQLLREKTLRYYEETLLSRLNNSKVPIVLIMQRLHKEDLSGILADKYHYNVICKPLLDENDICQIPSQYTPERIKELQVNTFMFKSQYQQQPISEGGNVFKSEWFRYYPTQKEWHYKRVLIAADTAMKVKEHNDYSVFIAGGVTDNNQLHILDMIRGKWEAPELERQAVTFWNRFKRDEHTGVTCSGLYLEDKASGIGLIQTLQSKYGMPVIGLQVEADKLTRAEGVLNYIESGQVYLPENPNYSFNPDLIAECEEFSRDGSQKHDDIVDSLVYLIREALSKTVVSVLDYFM